MMPTTSKSLERTSFAAMAALTLAPVFFHGGWLLLASALGAKGDSLGLTLASLLVAGAAVTAHILFNQKVLLSSIVVSSLVGLASAIALGKDFQSMAVIALALIALALFVSSLMTWLVTHLPADLDGLAKQHKIKSVLFVLLVAFSIGQTARLSTFMGDARRADLSAMPELTFLVTHSCLSAYANALQLAQAGQKNLYDIALWPDEVQLADQRGADLVTSGPYAPFYLDTYMYPPQFLLLPAVLFGFSQNFLVQRAIWFGFSGLFLALGFWAVAIWVSEKDKRHALWLIPLLWSSLVVMTTFQVGNAHHIIMVMAVLGMIAFERKQPALGGALLAFAIVAKISPIFLVIVLLTQRRWRDTAWTFAFGMIFTLLTVLFFGIQPIVSFLTYELPRLSSGAAMSWMDSATINIIINSSPFGIPFKLAGLGLHFDNVWGVARIINNIYTLCILALTVLAALAPRKRESAQKLYLWLGVLTLSALQSPFAPAYTIMPAVWILMLFAAETKKAAGLVAIAVLWLFLAALPGGTETAQMAGSLIQQIVIIGLVVFAIFRKPAPPVTPAQPEGTLELAQG